MNINLTQEQLKLQLIEQLQELQALCETYDIRGDIVHKSISIKLRLLFHQTQKSNSLLNQLDILDKEMISTSGQKIEGNLFKFFHGLVRLKVQPDSRQIFVPGKLLSQKRVVSLKYWWQEEVILTDNTGYDFTRKDVVLNIANKDGGGHVDSKVSIEYYNLKTGKTSGVVFNRNGVTYTFNPLIASIRQIAEEVLLSFKYKYL